MILSLSLSFFTPAALANETEGTVTITTNFLSQTNRLSEIVGINWSDAVPSFLSLYVLGGMYGEKQVQVYYPRLEPAYLEMPKKAVFQFIGGYLGQKTSFVADIKSRKAYVLVGGEMRQDHGPVECRKAKLVPIDLPLSEIIGWGDKKLYDEVSRPGWVTYRLDDRYDTVGFDGCFSRVNDETASFGYRYEFLKL